MLRSANKWFDCNTLRAVTKVVFCLGFILASGCTGVNYRGVEGSRDVTQAFETYQVFPGHRYYYLNQENNPYAVAALGDSYSIGDRQWREFDPQTDKLEKTVDLVKAFPVNYARAYGSYLKDSSGNQFGYWYSSIRLRTLKVDNEAKRVSLYTDTPWLRDDDRRFGTGIGIRINR